MISVLIPVYNYDITSLVNCLQRYIAESSDFDEIIIGSDGSDDNFLDQYKKLASLERVKLVNSPRNRGRAAIRNLMAESTSASHLLFIDADALMPSDTSAYLEEYSNSISKAAVVCGGVAYRSTPPDDPDKLLRWRYGSSREQKSARRRNRKPYASFSGFNFMVEKELFDKVRFDDEFRKYGHEDTLFGYRLKELGVKVLHIENCLVHDGLEPNRIFLQKSEEGIDNLSLLYDKIDDRRSLAKQVKLLRYYSFLYNTGLNRLAEKFYNRWGTRLAITFRSGKGAVWLFSLYRLAMFCRYRLKGN